MLHIYFKLWKAYLRMRMSYVLGTLIVKKRAGGKKEFPEMKDALEDEKDDLEQWKDQLHPVLGWEEWKSLVTTFERALMWIPNVRLQISFFSLNSYLQTNQLPRLWLMYLSIFSHPLCPPPLSHTHARHTYDRALRPLPPSLHFRIFFFIATSSGQNP